VIHNRTQELGRSLTKAETKQAIHEASVEIRTAAGFGQLIIVVVFLPVFSLVGIEGKMFKPMAATFVIAILAALIFSFTLAPALASLFLRGKIENKEPWIMHKIEQLYTPILDFILKHRVLTFGIGLISTLFGLFLFLRLGGEFLPQLDEGSLLIESTRPVKIGIDQSVALQGKTEALISQFPEVAYTFSKIGTAEIASDPMWVNQADTYVMFKNEKDWPVFNGKKRTRQEIGKLMTEKLNAELPGQVILNLFKRDLTICSRVQKQMSRLNFLGMIWTNSRILPATYPKSLAK
jgi:cobalt-zinc-cadmium resistance protein CzcA